MHAPVAGTHVGGALEAISALRVAPVVHHGRREALALRLRCLLCLLLADCGLLWHEARGVCVGPSGGGLLLALGRVRVLPRRGGGQRAGLPQLQIRISIAVAHVGGALEAIGALRVAPVIHHGGLERLALLLGLLLRALLGSRQRRDPRALRLAVVLQLELRQKIFRRPARAHFRAMSAGRAAVPAPTLVTLLSRALQTIVFLASAPI